MALSDQSGVGAPFSADGVRPERVAARFQSILFTGSLADADVDGPQEPDFFADLNLDQVLASMTTGREQYDLKPLFSAPLHEVQAVRYRHEVLRDLEKPDVLASINGFAERMRRMRAHLGQVERLHYQLQRQAWFLHAVGLYCDAVRTLAEELAGREVPSRGLDGFGGYLAGYAASERFTWLVAETKTLKQALAGIRSSLGIRGAKVTVSRYKGQADSSAEVEHSFAKFQQGAVNSYPVKLPTTPTWARSRRGSPSAAPGCTRRCSHGSPSAAPATATLSTPPSAGSTVRCSSPSPASSWSGASARRACRCATRRSPPLQTGRRAGAVRHRAGQQARRRGRHGRRQRLVLRGPERVLVVTGANNGGKTTFARTVGQLHYLASLGLLVPGRQARRFLPDRTSTHFERQEDIQTLRGTFDDELVCVHQILERVTSDSVIVLNESFGSTTLNDALFVGTQVMRPILERGCLGVYVTFVDELASLSQATVRMVSQILPENPAERTFKLLRRPADAWAIAHKYGLTYQRLRKRIGSSRSSCCPQTRTAPSSRSCATRSSRRW